MNTKKKIEQYLHAAPNPSAPDGLLNKLKDDVTATEIKTHRSAIRRWFAPDGQRVSLWRLTCAAVIAIAVMLPLSYGATKIIRTYVFEEETETIQTNKDGSVTVTVTATTTGLSGDYANRKEAKKEYDEISALRKAGKYEKTLKKEWVKNGTKIRLYKVRYTLSNGKVITMNESEAASATDEDKQQPD